jgi:lysylphosphatidylglycerol synthetase-like protein (DUF2156 family)
MESTNISTRVEKPWKINLTFVMSALALISCILGIVNAFNVIKTSEYYVNAIYYIVIAIAFAILVALSGFRKYANTSKIAFVYLVLAVLVVYTVTRVIWTATALNSRVLAIANDTTNYTTDTSRQFAINALRRKSGGIIATGIITLIGMAFMFYFATKKTLDGETRWPYYLTFGLTLFALYLVCYNEVNFLNNTATLDKAFWALFSESRASVVCFISIFVINVVNDYDPDKDPIFATPATAK